jgi:hypothetical protein
MPYPHATCREGVLGQDIRVNRPAYQTDPITQQLVCVCLVPSSVINVVTLAEGHLLLITDQKHSKVSVSSLSESAHATGCPTCNKKQLCELNVCVWYVIPFLYSSATTTVKSLNRYWFVLWVESRHTILSLKLLNSETWNGVIMMRRKVSSASMGKSGSRVLWAL